MVSISLFLCLLVLLLFIFVGGGSFCFVLLGFFLLIGWFVSCGVFFNFIFSVLLVFNLDLPCLQLNQLLLVLVILLHRKGTIHFLVIAACYILKDGHPFKVNKPVYFNY